MMRRRYTFKEIIELFILDLIAFVYEAVTGKREYDLSFKFFGSECRIRREESESGVYTEWKL